MTDNARMSEPQRIQRRRTAGWRLPEGAVCVTRGTEWGNPWREGTSAWTIGPGGFIDRSGKVLTRQDAVDSYRHSVECSPEAVAYIREHLAGKTLACWCPLPAEGEPDICHAAVLLRVAAGGLGETGGGNPGAVASETGPSTR